jgi:1-acyl-sn-glycerol-3-phosphate acyltransferase
MSAIGRRLLSCTIVGLALPLSVISALLWVPVVALIDAFHRLFKFPTVRLGVFGIVYLAHEWIALNAAVVLGILRLVGWRRNDPVGQVTPYRRVQAWWAASLLRWASRLLGVRLDLQDTGTLPEGGFILLSRHASMIDAVLPLHLVTNHLDQFVHYVLKREMRWVPIFDVYGHRLGNYFVTRSGDGTAEATAIAEFADRARPDSALVIFPEGTYATPASRARVRNSLERNGEDHLLALADELDHLLPPKPAGSLALLRSQPNLDVVIFGHVGLEGVAQLNGLRQRLPLTAPVVVRWWIHERTTVPDSDQDRIAWLNQQWRTLDDWVGSVHRDIQPPGDLR